MRKLEINCAASGAQSDRAMTVPNALASELLAMIQRVSGRKKPIPRSAALYQDLQIAGDDAYELFEMVAARFGTSFAGFDCQTYFPNESEALPLYLASRLGFRDRKIPPLTVEHLLAVVERGTWFDPIPSGGTPHRSANGVADE